MVNRSTETSKVMVITDAIDFDMFTIQEETLCSIECKGTNSDACLIRISQFFIAFNLYDDFVQKWIFN